MSNVFGVTTPYVDSTGGGYYEALGALQFSPHSAVDPTSHSPMQHQRQDSEALPQWKGVARVVRRSPADNAPNGNYLPRPGNQASKHKAQPDNQTVGLDYDEMVGVRDDSDAEARMRRLLNQLKLDTQPDSRAAYEGGWASSSSTSLNQGAPPYRNTQAPSVLTRTSFARQLGGPKAAPDPVPLHDMKHDYAQDDDVIDYYFQASSRPQVSVQTSHFPNSPQNIPARPRLPRYKSAPSTPTTTSLPPRPTRSPRRAVTVGGGDPTANYAPPRKPSLVRGGSEQSLYELSRQNPRPAQPGHMYGRSNSSGNLSVNPPATPASPGLALPPLISDSISRTSSFASLQTRLVTPTDSTAPTLSGGPHPLGRIDEKASLDYNQIEAAKARHMILPQTPSHISSGAKEREMAMEKRPGLKLVTPLPPNGWRTPMSAEFSSAKYSRSAATTPALSSFDMGGIERGMSVGGSFSAFQERTMPKGGLQRSYSRGGVSEFSSFTGTTMSRTSAGMTNSMQEKATPTVAAATAFAMSGTMPVGVPLSKAERAAEKAREKAERATKKAEAALLKVELEREAKAQQEETKRAAAENKRQTAEARKKERDERLRQAELPLARLIFNT